MMDYFADNATVGEWSDFYENLAWKLTSLYDEDQKFTGMTSKKTVRASQRKVTQTGLYQRILICCRAQSQPQALFGRLVGNC